MRISALFVFVLLGLVGCATQNGPRPVSQSTSIPPPGPTRTIILPSGRTFTCNVVGGAICPGP